MRRQHNPQSGAAIISILLVFTLASILFSIAFTEQQYWIARTKSFVEQSQTYHYARGAETYAKQVLLEDRKRSSYDHKGETWGQIQKGFTIENGAILLHIEDITGRFNINNLLYGANDADIDTARTHFHTLLKQLGLNNELTYTIIDWLDGDARVSFSGAEDEDYLQETPPYLAGNQPLIDISELRLLKGMAPEYYDTLVRHITALPRSSYTFNINSVSQPLLSIVLPPGEESGTLLALKASRGFVAPQDIESANLFLSYIDITSDYFTIHIEARYGDTRTYMTSRVYRRYNGGEVILDTLSRSLGNPYL